MNITEALPAGTEIGNYRIEAVLGRGGGAVTYYCTDTLLGREVALKEHFPQGLCRRTAEGEVTALPGMEEVFEDSVNVFLNEARTVAGLKHEHIVPIHDVQAARGTAYAVLELEEGELLDAWLTAHAREPRRIRRVLLSLLGVLAYLHERSVYHRDIKPANIMVREGDNPVLLDFGAAHVGDFTGQRTIIGTPQFAAPEQFDAAGDQGPWSDLYALGASFLHGLGAEAVADLPRRLRRSLYKATRKDPARRFRSAAEWQRALLMPALWPWFCLALPCLVAIVCAVCHVLLSPAEQTPPDPPAAVGTPAASAPQESPAEEEEEEEFSLADIPRTLNGYTLHIQTRDKVCYQSNADLQHWEDMEEADVIDVLKDAFFDPKREPLNARLNPNYFSFGEKTWKIENEESDYSYKRLEGSALSLLTVSNVSKTERKPYLMWFSTPTEGVLAFPVDNGLHVWSRVAFKLVPNENYRAQIRLKTEAPESPAGQYLLLDHTQMQSYPVKPDSAVEPDTKTAKKQMTVVAPLAYSGILFKDEKHWESFQERGTYTYERVKPTEARITLHLDESADDQALYLYLQFVRNTSGTLHKHLLGDPEACCNISFEMQPFGISPHGANFNMFFSPEDLRPTAAPTPE